MSMTHTRRGALATALGTVAAGIAAALPAKSTSRIPLPAPPPTAHEIADPELLAVMQHNYGTHMYEMAIGLSIARGWYQQYPELVAGELSPEFRAAVARGSDIDWQSEETHLNGHDAILKPDYQKQLRKNSARMIDVAYDVAERQKRERELEAKKKKPKMTEGELRRLADELRSEADRLTTYANELPA